MTSLGNASVGARGSKRLLRSVLVVALAAAIFLGHSYVTRSWPWSGTPSIDVMPFLYGLAILLGTYFLYSGTRGVLTGCVKSPYVYAKIGPNILKSADPFMYWWTVIYVFFIGVSFAFIGLRGFGWLN